MSEPEAPQRKKMKQSVLRFTNNPEDSLAMATSLISPNATQTALDTSVSNSIETQSNLTEVTAHSLDIGNYIAIPNIDNHLKLELLKNPWVPPNNYVFPFSEHSKQGKLEKRYLSHKQLAIDNCYSYSDVCKGVLCRICVLFQQTGTANNQSQQKLGILVTKPLTNFSKLTGKDGALTSHLQKEYHINSKLNAQHFLHFMANPMKNDIRNIADSQRKIQVEQNRQRLRPIIETLIFHGRQNIPLRGHRDDGCLVVKADDALSLTNEGNFRETLRLRIQSGDKQLENHLSSSSSRATYISKTTQNTIINLLGDMYKEHILQTVKAAKFYTIISDGTTDINHVEQLSIIIRYFCPTSKMIKEQFIGFYDLLQTIYGSESSDIEPRCSGKAYATALKSAIDNSPLRDCTLVGIGLDGASVNSSEIMGVGAILSQEHTLAIPVHCASHCLNLVLINACKLPEIRNAFGVIQQVGSFFKASAKRTSVLNKVIDEADNSHKLSKVKSLCETRWVERHDAVDVFLILLDPINIALEKITNWNDSKTAAMANCLLAAIHKCSFIIAINIMTRVLALTKGLSVMLQTVNIDLFNIVTQIEATIHQLEVWRTSCNEQFHEMYNDVLNTCNSMDIDIRVPRTNNRQTNRSNIQHDNAEQYFCRSMYIPFLEHLTEEMKSRFSKHKTKIFALSRLIPSICINANITDLDKTAEFYSDHLNEFGSIDMAIRETRSEFERWKLFWNLKKEEERPTNAVDALLACDSMVYPSLHTLLIICATLPTTVASAERSFSTLRRLKSYLRSTMTENRLSGLALMNVHREIQLSIDTVIDKFAASGNRRLDFLI